MSNAKKMKMNDEELSRSLLNVRKLLYHNHTDELQQYIKNDLMAIVNGSDKCNEIRSKMIINEADKSNNLIEIFRLFCPDNCLLENITKIDAYQLMQIIDNLGIALARYAWVCF